MWLLNYFTQSKEHEKTHLFITSSYFSHFPKKDQEFLFCVSNLKYPVMMEVLEETFSDMAATKVR